MATERQIQEAVALGVSALVCYHNSVPSPKATKQMVVDVRRLAGIVERLGLNAAEVEKLIVRPLEGELLDRYGSEEGFRLLGEFTDAFGGAGGADRAPRNGERPHFDIPRAAADS